MTGSDSKLFGRHIKTLQRVPAPGLILLAVRFFAVSAVNAADFSGPVVSVLDGDTIEVLHNTRAERIRLDGIDCPEKGQAYGKRAKHAASGLVFGKEVTLQTDGTDNTGARLPMYSSLMNPTSTMSWSNKAGAGGIRNMHQRM